MERESVAAAIRAFIVGHFPAAAKRALKDQDALLESGIVDSLGVLDVVSFIESEFQVKVDDDDLLPENFQNIECMTAYVERKRNGGI